MSALVQGFPSKARRGPRIGLLSAWSSRLGGGVFEAVVAHAALLREFGYEPIVVALDDVHSTEDRSRFGDTQVITCRVTGPRAIGFAPDLVSALMRADVDLLHLHGIWMYPSHAGARWAAATGRPYVISPHGMLDPWITGRGRAKKFLARIGYERRSWRSAGRFHALTEREADDITVATRRSDRAAVIPNAIAPGIRSTFASPSRTVLYVGRIHPKKNLGALVDAWRIAAPTWQGTDTQLLVAGWGEDPHVREFQQKLAAQPSTIRFLGPVYGARKAELLDQASFVVLPSLSEGLPVAILEGWAAGTPSIMSEGCNLPEGFARGAAIESGVTANRIAAALISALCLRTEEWRAMSSAAMALAHERFSPTVVGRAWQELYDDLLLAPNRGPFLRE